MSRVMVEIGGINSGHPGEAGEEFLVGEAGCIWNIITHLRSTTELADTLHGIRARRDGTSFIKFYFEMNERLLRAYKCC
ncbi:MAG: hypothetical protein ACOY40_06855 [Bacillota bacterium]